MTGASRGGRPWGPIRAESREAAALARFLRARVDMSGKTLAVLAKEINYSKSQVSAFLAGKVPEEPFVTAMVRATAEPLLRERRLAEAAGLLRAAEQPSPTTTAPPPDSLAMELAAVRAQQVQTYERLTRALDQQNQLHEAAGNSTKLVMILLTMIDKLTRRITDLTGEADQLRAAQADTAVLARTQQQLTRAQEQERRAQQELARAQEKQRQAEDLAARVQARVDQLTDELDRLRAGTPDDTTPDSDPPHHPHETTPGADPVGDDIDHALARAAEVNNHDDGLLQRIAGEFNPHDLTAVVRDKHPDNPPTGSDHPHTLAIRRTLAGQRGLAGDAAGAVRELAELLPEAERVLGPDHPDTLAIRRILAGWRGVAGDAAGAVRELAELLPAAERALGPDHPDTLTTQHLLTDWRNWRPKN